MRAMVVVFRQKGTNSRIYSAAQSKAASDRNVRISDRLESTAAGGKRNGGAKRACVTPNVIAVNTSSDLFRPPMSTTSFSFFGDDEEGTEHILHNVRARYGARGVIELASFLFSGPLTSPSANASEIGNASITAGGGRFRLR